MSLFITATIEVESTIVKARKLKAQIKALETELKDAEKTIKNEFITHNAVEIKDNGGTLLASWYERTQERLNVETLKERYLEAYTNSLELKTSKVLLIK